MKYSFILFKQYKAATVLLAKARSTHEIESMRAVCERMREAYTNQLIKEGVL